MALTAGTRLGPYEILAPIGAGGMGEVYRALDTKLKRDVALKVLPEAFAQNPDRMLRFQREAEVLASLNHPHIAHIYGVEEHALVMELVEGETLPAGLPLDTALDYGRQIAEALEYAHERGVIHRDLKPANIKVTPEGTVKLLDFGLAKAIEDPATSDGNPVTSPTLTLGATHVGMILGTAAYMSPEQAGGKTADRRADIWSFGAVLYEMLSGKRAFDGESASDTLASVLKLDPDWTGLPSVTPPSIRWLIRRCLTKDRKQRLQAIGEARILLESPSTSQEEPAPRPRRQLAWIAVSAILLLALIALSFVHFRKAPAPETRSVRFQVPLPEKSTDAIFRLSPDGRYLAIAGSLLETNSQLWVRPLDSLEARALPGTEGAYLPFWSPDSALIGFFAQGKLKRIALAGGAPQTICDASYGGGGAWNRNGVIVFTPGIGKPFFRVSAAGGTPVPVTTPAGPLSPGAGYFPQFLPESDRFLYVSADRGKPEVTGIYVGSLDGKPPVRILASPFSATYVPPNASGRIGHLLFLRENTLMAQAFDSVQLRPSGEMVPLAEPVGRELFGFLPAFSVSDSGVLAYSSSAAGASRELVWLDRTGKQIGLAGPPGEYNNFRLSPDEKTMVMDRSANSSAPDIWVLDVLSGVASRLTFDPAVDNLPIWSPDGLRVLFPSNRKGSFDLYLKAASGAGQEEPLIKLGTSTGWATDWSRDGRFILYQIPSANTGQDLWIAPQFGDRKPFPYLQTQFNEQDGAFSPDGRWIAYVSDESGRAEIYVQAFPLSGEKHQISTGGGSEPCWRKDGTELFYLAADRNLMAVPVRLGTTITTGAPKPLFPVPLSEQRHSYSATSDGQRFLVGRLAGEMPPITVVLNWQAGLTK
jgi:serine/threonine protein kinase/Tol biopolymer transport system component